MEGRKLSAVLKVGEFYIFRIRVSLVGKLPIGLEPHIAEQAFPILHHIRDSIPECITLQALEQYWEEESNLPLLLTSGFSLRDGFLNYKDDEKIDFLEGPRQYIDALGEAFDSHCNHFVSINPAGEIRFLETPVLRRAVTQSEEQDVFRAAGEFNQSLIMNKCLSASQVGLKLLVATVKDLKTYISRSILKNLANKADLAIYCTECNKEHHYSHFHDEGRFQHWFSLLVIVATEFEDTVHFIRCCNKALLHC